MEVKWNLYVVVGIALIASVQCDPKKTLRPVGPFDFLTFSQQWSPTTSFVLKQKHAPSKDFKWTIHGLWPSMNNKEKVEYCDSPTNFNTLTLLAIEKQLKVQWPSVYDTNKFWSEQWNKHGKCATWNDELNGLLKYFQKAMGLNKKYDFATILRKAQILVGKSYSPKTIFDTIQKGLGKRAQVHCIINPETYAPYLSEIRVCLDLKFQLIDCKHTEAECPRDHDVLYLSTVPK